jgi:Predicted transcriptional regulator
LATLDLKQMGQRLQDARYKSGFNLTQVASYLNISETELLNYENGEADIFLSVLDQLVNLYGIELLSFINEGDEGEPAIHLDCKPATLTDEDIRVIGWSKEFLNNLYFMKKVKSKE